MRKVVIGVCLGLAVLTLVLLQTPAGLLAQKSEDPEECVETPKGPIGAAGGAAAGGGQMVAAAPAHVPSAMVGKPAPDFEANGFVAGKFQNITLSDYKGKWVVLCFYPGDFTFV
jgi:peroxiredoxin (alkyl hydroperoxide reductase subunit C)